MAVVTDRSRRVTLVTRWQVPGVQAVLLPLMAVVLVLGAALVAYEGRALPGITVAGIDVGSLERSAVRERLASQLAAPWAAAAVVARHEGATWTGTNAELGIIPDIDAATDAALAYGRSGSLVDRAAAWLSALTRGANVPFVMRVEGDALERHVVRIASGIDRPAVAGEIRLAPDGAAIRAPVAGRELDRNATAGAYLAAPTLGDRIVELRVRTLHPSVDEAGIAEAAALVRAVTTPLRVEADGRGIDEVAAGLATLLRVERVAARPGELPAIPTGVVAPASRFRFVATVDEARVGAWAAAVAAALDRPAKSATYKLRPDGSLEVVPGQNGVKIDPAAFAAMALAELTQPTGDRRVLVPTFVKDTPVFTTEQAERYVGQMTRVVAFETFFPPDLARWKNISTGASQFDGLVLAPGEIFSFWDRIGPVTPARGYAYAGAIIEGRSQDDVIGGGLCQVSTTLFYSVAKAGFQILERGAHAYYIDRYPLGLDAAVFHPGYDFKWKNDTAFPVLIRSSWSNIAVEFEVFTVPNGRTVSFSDPVQTNWRDVRPDQAADPHFPPGSKVMGRDVTRTRTVTENGRVVHQDVWVSRYNAVWGGPAAAPPAP